MKDVLERIATTPVNQVQQLLPHHWGNSIKNKK